MMDPLAQYVAQEFIWGGACFFWLVGLAASVFWIWMIIDALINEPTTTDKLLWFLVIFFLHIIGALIYFFLRRSSRPRVGSP